MKRLLITGSRTWSDVELLKNTLLAETEKEGIQGWVLVSGHCPDGADYLAEIIWRAAGGRIETHPANWYKYGKSAGYRRNQEMVDLGADLCIAFIKNDSKGATHTMEAAIKAMIPTLVVRHDT